MRDIVPAFDQHLLIVLPVVIVGDESNPAGMYLNVFSEFELVCLSEAAFYPYVAFVFLNIQFDYSEGRDHRAQG